MTNYEKIKDIEISGAKPFAGLSRVDLVELIKGKESCTLCPVSQTTDECYEIDRPCAEVILDWLEAEAK